jgi:hypothetical protein
LTLSIRSFSLQAVPQSRGRKQAIISKSSHLGEVSPLPSPVQGSTLKMKELVMINLNSSGSMLQNMAESEKCNGHVSKNTPLFL